VAYANQKCQGSRIFTFGKLCEIGKRIIFQLVLFDFHSRAGSFEGEVLGGKSLLSD
jgi:hypothetical protein